MGGLNGGYGTSSSDTSESTLSREQAKILKAREAQYQAYFFPELASGLKDTSNNTITTPLMTKMAGEINQQSSQAKGSFSQAMAQRGLAGSGVEAQGIASLDRAKTSSFADAFLNAQAANTEQKNKLIQIGAGMSPTPTQSAQLNSSASSKNWNAGGTIMGG